METTSHCIRDSRVYTGLSCHPILTCSYSFEKVVRTCRPHPFGLTLGRQLSSRRQFPIIIYKVLFRVLLIPKRLGGEVYSGSDQSLPLSSPCFIPLGLKYPWKAVLSQLELPLSGIIMIVVWRLPSSSACSICCNPLPQFNGLSKFDSRPSLLTLG